MNDRERRELESLRDKDIEAYHHYLEQLQNTAAYMDEKYGIDRQDRWTAAERGTFNFLYEEVRRREKRVRETEERLRRG